MAGRGESDIWNVTFQSIGIHERISFHREWIDGHMTNPEFCLSGPNSAVTRKYLEEKKAKYVWIGTSAALAVIISVLVILLNRKSKSLFDGKFLFLTSFIQKSNKKLKFQVRY